jgi:hypothetical protein
MIITDGDGEEKPSLVSALFILGGLAIAGLILVPVVSDLLKPRRKRASPKRRRK